jgi:sugar lactone lactonase YvrE
MSKNNHAAGTAKTRGILIPAMLLVLCLFLCPVGLCEESLTITTLAGQAGVEGSANGTGSAATFYNPMGVAVDSSGNVYVADYFNSSIRMITSSGVVTTLAETGNCPMGVAVDGSSNIYVADGNTISKITSDGEVAALANTYSPTGVAVDGSGNLYVANSGSSGNNITFTISKITPDGAVTTLAGKKGVKGSANGKGCAAQFYFPQGVAVDNSGNVYVADSGNNTIRKITPAGVVTTLAGTAGVEGSTDGTGDAAQFCCPSGVALDDNGNVYVADSGNNTIRMITPAGVVTTLAGAAGVAGSADGTGDAAQFKGLLGVAVDNSGNVYVGDTYNNTIRVGTPIFLPVFSSLPTACPTLGTAGEPVTFTVTATDAAGDVLTYTWNFGDETYGSGASPTHTYTSAGLYTVTVTVSNGVASNMSTLYVGINSQDGTGTNPYQFKVQKATIKFNFIPDKSMSDSMTLSGELPVPADFVPNGMTLSVNIGNYESGFRLDKNGKATFTTYTDGTTSTDKIQLTGVLKNGAYRSSPVKFLYMVKKQTLFPSLTDLGFDNDNVKPADHDKVDVPVLFTLNGNFYLDTPTLSYTAKQGKLGVAQYTSK